MVAPNDYMSKLKARTIALKSSPALHLSFVKPLASPTLHDVRPAAAVFFSFLGRSAAPSGPSSKTSPIHDVYQVTAVLLFPRQLGSAIRVFLKVFTLQPCVAVHIAHRNPSIHQGSKIYFSLLPHAMDSKLLRPIKYV